MENGRAPEDRRRFETEMANELWQAGALHDPCVTVDDKQKKTYLFAFIDDCSRLIPHAEFYLSEKIDDYYDALRKALRK